MNIVRKGFPLQRPREIGAQVLHERLTRKGTRAKTNWLSSSIRTDPSVDVTAVWRFPFQSQKVEKSIIIFRRCSPHFSFCLLLF